MKNLKILAGFLLVLLISSSCTINRKSVPLVPVNAQINFSIDDLEYIGDVVGTSKQSYFIGIPYGERKNTAGIAVLNSGFNLTSPLTRGYNNALYDALMQKPDADFLMPLNTETIRHQMFLGSEVEIKVRAKAFKLKSK